jgi:hypothetical protein
MIERTPQEVIPEGFLCQTPVLPRVAVIAATLAFSRQVLENRLNQSHRNLGPVVTGIHWHHLLSISVGELPI